MTGKTWWLVTTASLMGFLGSVSMGFAQAERPWIDPPSEAVSVPQATSPSTPPTSSPAKPVESPPHSALTPPPVAARPEGVAPDAPKTDVQPSSASPSRKIAGKRLSKEKAATVRKNRGSSREANASVNSSRHKGTVARQRDQGTTGSIGLAQSEGRSSLERRGRTRFERVQAGIDSGLEVMNLRTIQLPDGRRIRILTRPDPDSMSRLLAQPY